MLIFSPFLAGLQHPFDFVHICYDLVMIYTIELLKKDILNIELALKSDIALVRKDIKWIMIGGSILGAIIVTGFTMLGLLITLHH